MHVYDGVLLFFPTPFNYKRVLKVFEMQDHKQGVFVLQAQGVFASPILLLKFVHDWASKILQVILFVHNLHDYIFEFRSC